MARLQKQLLFALCILVFIGCNKSQNPYIFFEEGYHYRDGVWSLGGPTRVQQYKFNNVPRLCGMITHFPADSILAEVDAREGQDIVVSFWIHTSVEDAELSLVEYVDRNPHLSYNMIDYPLPDGAIGDNGYYRHNIPYVNFVRNNIRVRVEVRRVDFPTPWEEIENVARRIDNAIIAAPKVGSGKQVPAPIIHSIKLLPPFPKWWAERATVKVSATDAVFDTLFYRMVGHGPSFYDGIENFRLDSVYAPVYWTDNPNKFRFMAWVWNEDNIVALAEKVFEFDK